MLKTSVSTPTHGVKGYTDRFTNFQLCKVVTNYFPKLLHQILIFLALFKCSLPCQFLVLGDFFVSTCKCWVVAVTSGKLGQMLARTHLLFLSKWCIVLWLLPLLLWDLESPSSCLEEPGNNQSVQGVNAAWNNL